jgi:hypothetical protein
MAHADNRFEERLSRLSQRQGRAKQALPYQIRPDGKVVTQPRRCLPSFPLRGLVLLIGSGLLFKAVLFGHLGESGYTSKLDALRGGNLLEQAGAAVMRADPATRAIAATWGRYIRQLP